MLNILKNLPRRAASRPHADFHEASAVGGDPGVLGQETAWERRDRHRVGLEEHDVALAGRTLATGEVHDHVSLKLIAGGRE